MHSILCGFTLDVGTSFVQNKAMEKLAPFFSKTTQKTEDGPKKNITDLLTPSFSTETIGKKSKNTSQPEPALKPGRTPKNSSLNSEIQKSSKIST